MEFSNQGDPVRSPRGRGVALNAPDAESWSSEASLCAGVVKPAWRVRFLGLAPK